MLVQSKFKQDEILLLRLVTGEELMGKLEEENAIHYKIKKPALVVVGQNQEGKLVFDLQPPMYSMDINKSVEIMKTGVLMATYPRDDMKNGYIKGTSGIEVAGANALDGLKSS